MTEHNKNEKGTNMTQQEILEIIVKALDSKRAEDIQVLRVHDLTILGDYFIIANGKIGRAHV